MRKQQMNASHLLFAQFLYPSSANYHKGRDLPKKGGKEEEDRQTKSGTISISTNFHLWGGVCRNRLGRRRWGVYQSRML